MIAAPLCAVKTSVPIRHCMELIGGGGASGGADRSGGTQFFHPPFKHITEARNNTSHPSDCYMASF